MPDVRDEVALQQTLDRNWGRFQTVLDARLRAVVGAREAFAQGELGGGWAFRQALVDLSAVAAALAGELPPPRIPSTQAVAGRVKRTV